ncbi:MAG TPA: hypothetical protein VJA47_00910 [archaeon]|nr:hypothetical protein [archaeon]
MVNGVVLLDKPAGITSREVTEKVRQAVGAKKAGNTGILDPGSTGVLVICLDEATKAMPLLMGLDKEYAAKMLLHKNVDKKQVTATLRGFVGKIKQLPPVRSAVARKERERQIYSIDVLGISGRIVEFKIKCQAGFYVRKFIHGVGQDLGCGAQMVGLRRTAVDKIGVSQCVGFDELETNNIISLEEILGKVGVKKVCVKKEFLQNVLNGKFLAAEDIEVADKGLEKDRFIAVYAGKKLAAIGKVLKTKPMYIKPDRVFNIVKGVFD